MEEARTCAVCLAIARELRDSLRQTDSTITAGQLSRYVHELNEDDCARLRETSDLWKTWRQLQEHRALSGHSLSLSGLPPDAITNPN